MTSKATFRALCAKPNDLPIFFQDWWLDMMCGDQQWDVIMVEKGGNLQGVLPYYRQTKYRFKGIAMPKLTHFLGYWIYYPKGQKPSSRLSHEKKIVTELYNNLPEYSYFEQLIAPSYTNWLPLYWMGYQQTTLYTYIINDLNNLDKIYDAMESRLRNTIRKAEENLTIKVDPNVDILYDLVSKSYARNKERIPFSKDLVKEMVEKCVAKNCGKVHYAIDKEGNAHAASFTAWDQYSAYSILRGDDPELRSSGASSLLVWNAIKDCADKTKSFDFAGSYLEQVEHFIRSFGAIQTPYFYITKENSNLYYWLRRCYDFSKR